MQTKEKLTEIIKSTVVNAHGTKLGDVFHPEFVENIVNNLIEGGAIVPPCKVGDRLYQIVKMPKHTFVSEYPIIVEPQQIIYRNILGNHSCIPFEEFGKTVFLTREEAEKALKGGEGDVF